MLKRFNNKCLIFAAGLSLAGALMLPSCAKKTAPAGTVTLATQTTAGPPCIIYKTKADYSHLVPVELTADGKAVASYPDVRDVYIDGKPAYPTPLVNGFLLDNRGIGPHVAFLKLTYEEYHALPKTPDARELMTLVLIADPLTEMYRCGTRYQYQDLVGELNAIIQEGKLKDFPRLK